SRLHKRRMIPSLRSDGGDHPYEGRRTRVISGSPVKAARPYPDRVSSDDLPRFARVGGTTPHTPRESAYRRSPWVTPVKAPRPYPDRVSSDDLPRFARVGGRPPHTPRESAYRRSPWVTPVKAPRPYA